MKKFLLLCVLFFSLCQSNIVFARSHGLEQQLLEQNIAFARRESKPILNCLEDENGAKYFKDQLYVYHRDRDSSMKAAILLNDLAESVRKLSLEIGFPELEKKFTLFVNNDFDFSSLDRANFFL